MQQYTNLNPADQHRVLQGICSSGSNRIPFAQFSAYYEVLGSTIERDRDFEDLMRHHWGFAEVCDILDDMKNKFTMVGLAYTFRKGLEQGHPELTEQAFQQAISQVGMQYSSSDVRRVFDAFDGIGAGGPNASIEVLKLTTHLTSAPKPPTPLPALYGTAHFSEVNSQTDYNDRPSATPSHFGSGQYTLGALSNQHPEVPPAPPEDRELPEQLLAAPRAPPEEYDDGVAAPLEFNSANPNEPAPKAPLEEYDDGIPTPPEAGGNPNEPAPKAPPEDYDDGIKAPPESMGNPNEPPPEAPPEDEDGVEAPLEARRRHHPDGEDVPPEGFPGAGSFSPTRHHHGFTPGTVRPAMNHQQAAAAAGNSVPSGKRKAVTVGINYINTRNELSGCINDSDTFIKLLTAEFGYQVSDIRQLRDDHPQRMPTRKNITAALTWLVNGARSGDHLFFHYSGHGSQQTDRSGDERDGKDETLVPCDFQHHGMITDDDLQRILVTALPQGCRLTCIMDCCHSGTVLDLPYSIRVGADGQSTNLKKKKGYQARPAAGDCVMISGCMDKQTSADIGAGSAGNSKAAGAMTTAFKTVIEKDSCISFLNTIVEMRKFLKARGFVQVPQLASERFLNLSECFMPEVQPPTADPAPSTRLPMRKALTIGINYLTLHPGHGRLSGCINDSETMIGILKDTWGFQDNQIHRLRDDRANIMPTKANIIAAIRWLTQDAENGDEMFLHYSGHGGQVKDRNRDEKDGMDDTIIPCDFQTAGQITDDDLHSLLVDSLPQGCRLWVIMDCCHSGTALDLSYKVTMDAGGSITCKGRGSGSDRRPGAEVIMISGCKDTQTSADIGSGSLGVQKAAGAMTTAFRHSIKANTSCEDLLTNMRSYLKRNGFDQVPQMSSDKFIQMDVSFVHYQEKRKGKSELPASRTGLAAATSPLAGMASVDRVHPMSPQQGYMSPQGGGMAQDGLAFHDRLNNLQNQLAELRQATTPQQTGFPQLPPSSPMRGSTSPMLNGPFGASLNHSIAPPSWQEVAPVV
jgi:hypothetical protein